MVEKQKQIIKSYSLPGQTVLYITRSFPGAVISSKSLAGRLKIKQLQQKLKTDLLKTLGLNDLIATDEAGKPFLTDGRYISISHSGERVALVVSNRPVGVDIQLFSPKILQVQAKFINKEDFFHPEMDMQEQLHFLWTAKEALYKALGKKGISLKQDIIIKHISSDLKTAKGQIKNRTFNLFFLKRERYYIAVAYAIP